MSELRHAPKLAAAAALAVSLAAACSAEQPRSTKGGRGATAAQCAQKTSCGTCTPVLGCGWCQLEGGAGRCVDDPDDCADQSTFTWTWEPTGCRTSADAGASISTSRDSGRADARDADAPTDAAPEAGPADAGGD